MKTRCFFLLFLFLSGPWPQVLHAQVSGQSAPVSLNIRKKKFPPVLMIENIRFEDADDNNRIDGLEKCRIVFTLVNTGAGAAAGMKMNVDELAGVKGLQFSRQVSVPTIQPGSRIEMSFPAEGTIELADGRAQFAFDFEEPMGFPPDAFRVEIETKAFQSPDMVVADYVFSTESGMVRTGFPVQLKTLIQNQGQGVARQVNVTFVYPELNVFPNGEEQFDLGTIQPGETREVDFEFLANRLYTDPAVPIKISIRESYGRYAETKTASVTVDSRTENRTVTIASTATDRQVTITGASLTSDIERNVPENPGKNPHRYALIIGNEDYTRYQPGLATESNVPFAENDARTFQIYAEKTFGIPSQNITLITNAISSVMKREIEKLAKTIQYENGKAEVLFFFAGHGFPDEVTRESYLMPVDISGASVHMGIPLSGIYKELTAFPSKRVTIFLDACFSGGGRDAGLLAARAVRIKPKEEPVTGNLVVFTASTGEQSALQYNQQKHGMFTYFLLKTIQESRGEISYMELYDKVKQQVELHAVRINSKEQNPSVIYSHEVAGEWENWKLY